MGRAIGKYGVPPLFSQGDGFFFPAGRGPALARPKGPLALAQYPPPRPRPPHTSSGVFAFWEPLYGPWDLGKAGLEKGNTKPWP